MKVYTNLKKLNTGHTKLVNVNLIAVFNCSLKVNLNKIVDDIPPKIAEKIKLHNVNVSYYFFKFCSKKNIDKITP